MPTPVRPLMAIPKKVWDEYCIDLGMQRYGAVCTENALRDAVESGTIPKDVGELVVIQHVASKRMKIVNRPFVEFNDVEEEARD